MTIKDSGAPPKAAPKRFSITVGIHAAEGGADHTDGGTFADDGAIEFSGAEPRTVAEIASYHEFGLGVPQRSFIRGWFDESKEQMRELLRSQARLAIEGRITTEQAAERVALKAEAGVKLRIRNRGNGAYPPNAASTIARKKSTVPLIDTGQLRSAIRGKVSNE
jgi:hypothetical protein